MTLTKQISRHNFKSFLWHALFLALAQNFMDVDTVLPAMVIEAGGSAMHIGVLTAIMLGGGSFTQLFFAPYLSNKKFKRKFLLLGINSRILAIAGLGAILWFTAKIPDALVLWLIFLFIAQFAVGGAFANISFTDIVGKSMLEGSRKQFFSIRQAIMGTGVFFSALLAKKVLVSSTYPENYAYMFFIGFMALTIASLGFWRLKETVPSHMAIKGWKHFKQIFRKEFTENPRLKYFLGFVNTQGIVISFLPFVILYAKQTFNAGSEHTGSFLFFKVIGTVTAGFIIYFFSKKIKYSALLYGNVLLVSLSVLIALIANDTGILRFSFLIGGFVFSFYSIAMNGVLLEVSGNTNRALYTGIAGAGNIIPAIFPLLGGWIIKQFGFTPFFIVFLFIVSSSLYFIYKIDCKK